MQIYGADEDVCRPLWQNRSKSLPNNEKQLLPLKMSEQSHFPCNPITHNPLQGLFFDRVYVGKTRFSVSVCPKTLNMREHEVPRRRGEIPARRAGARCMPKAGAKSLPKAGE